jgi:DNA-binding LacI/PurR family transcriptional regulator
MGTSISSRLAARCKAVSVPVILFNLRSGEPRGFASVTVNNREGGRQIAEHLSTQGYRRLAFMGGPAHYKTPTEREEGFKEYLINHRADRYQRVVDCFERADASATGNQDCHAVHGRRRAAMSPEHPAQDALDLAMYTYAVNARITRF